MQDTALSPSRVAIWARFGAMAGLLWSLFGAYLFGAQTFADRAGLMAQGMTSAQADLYDSLPVWMGVAFGIGTLGGALGCVLLLLGRRTALPVLWASLAAYVALLTGDAIYGVFAAFGPPQVAVLSFVVAIAAALIWLARRLDRQGLLG